MEQKKKLVSILAGIMAGIMLLSLLLSLLASSVSALSSSEIKDQIDDLKAGYDGIQEQIKDLEENLKENTNQLQDMMARKDGIDQQIGLLYAQISNIEQQVSAYNLMIADKQEELDLAQQHLDKLSQQYKDRIRAMEEQGDLSYWSVIFQASSFADLLDRLNIVAEIANSDKMRIESMKQAAQEVAEAREKLAQEKLELEESKQILEEAQAVLEAKRNEADALLQDMIAKGDEFEQMMKEAEEEEQKALEEIAKKEEEYDKQKYQEWYQAWLATSKPPTTTKPGGPGNLVDGVVWYDPLPSYLYVSSEFGYRTHPVTGEVQSYHRGIDLPHYKGTPIYAARTGVVTVAQWGTTQGWYVTINHGDGYISTYMHMTHYIVKKGDFVTAGQIIGYVGTSGRSTGYHLHFGIAYNGTYHNPRKFIDFPG